MRDIKFRAWQEEKMYYQKTTGIYATKYFLDTIYEDCELMQYTGLNDKNGKQIYEGDIIRRYTGYVFEVEWRKYLLGNINHAKAYGYDFHESDEVIGNIYENPELLK